MKAKMSATVLVSTSYLCSGKLVKASAADSSTVQKVSYMDMANQLELEQLV